MSRMRAITDPPPLTFGRRLRRYRQARGLNQNELARLASISVFQLNRIERGARDAKVSTVARIAQALGVDLTEVFAREEVDIPA